MTFRLPYLMRWVLLAGILAGCHQSTTSTETPCPSGSLLDTALPAVERDIQHISLAESARGITASQTDRFVSAVRQLHVPGVVSLMAAGTDGRGRQSATLFEGISQEEIEKELRNAAEGVPVRIPGTPTLAVSKKELEQALHLLDAGQFGGDVRDVVATAIEAGFVIEKLDGGTLLGAIVRQGPHAISREWLCLEGVGKPGCMWKELPLAAKSLLTTGKVRNQVLFQETLQVLTGEAGGQQVARTMTRLLGNDTVRLAIVLYARSNGLSVTDEQVKDVRQFFDAQSAQQGNATVLITPAVSALTSKYQGDKVLMVLDRMANRRTHAPCRSRT